MSCALRSQLAEDPLYRQWAFLELSTLRLTNPSEILGYVQKYLDDENPSYCLSVVGDFGSRSYRILLKLSPRAIGFDLLGSLRPRSADDVVVYECSRVTPLMTCLDAFEADAEMWIGILSTSPYLIDRQGLLAEFEKYIQEALERARSGDINAQDVIPQTPSSS